MSTKSTILLTTDNEHWYNDCNAAYYQETKTEEAIVLEFDSKHRLEVDEDGSFQVVIESDSELYSKLSKMRLVLDKPEPISAEHLARYGRKGSDLG